MSQRRVRVEPQERRWTRDEFYRMADLGLFNGQRAELIGGTIMVPSPQKWPHASSVDRTGEVLRDVFGAGFWVRTQLPLNLGVASDPEPDISVVPGKREDYADHPTVALLVVEVSDTTLAFDRGEKASLYASAGVADYWIVNIGDQQLEVHRNPVPDPGQPHGWRYADQIVLTPGDMVTPLAAPSVSVAVALLIG